MDEIWKIAVGIDPIYEVSNLGRIRRISNDFIYKLYNDTNGYSIIKLKRNKKYVTVKVHRIVAMTWIDNPDNKPQVNHKDGLKYNNSVSNLEWCTAKENVKHSYKIGIRENQYRPPRGYLHWHSKPLFQYNKEGVMVKKWDCLSLAAAHFKGDESSIRRVLNGVRPSYKGFTFSRNG